MNKEEIVNLNMKDIILDKWKSKLSYPFRQTDLEELENIINYYEEENNQLKEQYCERTDCCGRLGNSKKVEELIKENEKLNHYKLLYQKVKDRNDKAIEYLEQEPVIEINGELRNIYSEDDNKLLEILKGENQPISLEEFDEYVIGDNEELWKY